MSFTPEEEAMGDRLDQYSGRAYNPVSEPFGFDRGGNQAGVFVRALKDVAGIGRAVARMAAEVVAGTAQTTEDARSAAASAQAASESADRAQTWDPTNYATRAFAAAEANRAGSAAVRASYYFNLHYGS